MHDVMESKPCADLDYKAEYESLLEEREKMHYELGYYHDELRRTEQENREMKAKLDMVYLIFGGFNRG